MALAPARRSCFRRGVWDGKMGGKSRKKLGKMMEKPREVIGKDGSGWQNWRNFGCDRFSCYLKVGCWNFIRKTLSLRILGFYYPEMDLNCPISDRFQRTGWIPRGNRPLELGKHKQRAASNPCPNWELKNNFPIIFPMFLLGFPFSQPIFHGNLKLMTGRRWLSPQVCSSSRRQQGGVTFTSNNLT